MTVYDDEIDLRPYINNVIKHWWQIGLIALLAGAIALGISLLISRKYEATTTILVTRSRSQLNLSSQFPTIYEPVDQVAHMDSLITITQSDSLALSTFKAMQDRLEGKAKDLVSFREQVTVSSKGDLIVITAFARTPELAAEIANTWAENSVQAINLAYNEGQPLAEVQSQLAEAQSQYEASQKELEKFLEASRYNEIEAEMNAADQALNTVSNLPVQQFRFYSNRKQVMEELAVQARGLKDQLENGSVSAAGQFGDALSVLFTRAQAFGLQSSLSVELNNTDTADAPKPPLSVDAPKLPLSLTLNTSQLGDMIDTSANYASDLEQLITLAEAEAEIAGTKIQEMSEQMSLPENQYR